MGRTPSPPLYVEPSRPEAGGPSNPRPTDSAPRFLPDQAANNWMASSVPFVFAAASPVEDNEEDDSSVHTLPIQVISPVDDPTPVQSVTTPAQSASLTVTPPSAPTSVPTKRHWSSILLVGLGLCACVVVLGTVCGTTNRCQSSPRAPTTIPRTVTVPEYIHGVTLTGRSIAPLTTWDRTEWPEELALHWLVHSDPLVARPDTSPRQWTQRYALLTLFVQFDTFHETMASFYSDECQWFGVTCEAKKDDQVVTHVNLSHSNYSGILSPDLGLLTSLVTFNASHTGVRGSLPDALSHWTRLESFDVSRAALEGTIPTTWGTWTALEHWNVAGNALTGSLPDDSIGPWTSLRHLNAQSNLLTGTMPHATRHWTEVQHLDVSFNDMFGSLPLGPWTRLEYLSVEANFLTGSLPSSMANWTRMVHCHVGDNFLTGTIPTLESWTQLRYFDAHNNILTGTLHPWWSAWRNLEFFNVSTNRLEGTLPELYSHWTALEILDVSLNYLTGTIPWSVGTAWTRLVHFEARENALTGSLPHSMGDWTKLKWYNVDRNRLNGTLPESIGQWSDVTYFSLSCNDFTGTIPSSIANWSRLHRAYFEGNRFTGHVSCPSARSWEIFSADCASNLNCSCCTDCDVALDVADCSDASDGPRL